MVIVLFLDRDFLQKAQKSTWRRFEALLPRSPSFDFVLTSLVLNSRSSEIISSSNFFDVLWPVLIFVGAKPAHCRRLRDLFIYLCVGLLVSRGLLRKSLRPETGKKMRESLGMRSAVRVE